MNPITPPNLADAHYAQHIQTIKKTALDAGLALREKHPILKQQSAIGMGILLLAWAGILGSALLALKFDVSLWLTIPMAAFFMSLTHELEHDLIHQMYFRQTPWVLNLMMALVWLARPSTINPWLRKHLHLNHHKRSGMADDIEERAITNGENWGIRRLIMLFDGVFAIVLRIHRASTWALRRRMVIRGAISYFPLGWLHWGVWHLICLKWLADGICTAGGFAPMAWQLGLNPIMPVLHGLLAVWFAPNLLRSFSLHFVSSNIHYFGDVEAGNLMQQVQVARVWWLVPFQLFCCNFGATHVIHHFAVKEPFYIRQWTAHQVYPALAAAGVRFNDFGSFKRANRWAMG